MQNLVLGLIDSSAPSASPWWVEFFRDIDPQVKAGLLIAAAIVGGIWLLSRQRGGKKDSSSR